MFSQGLAPTGETRPHTDCVYLLGNTPAALEKAEG